MSALPTDRPDDTESDGPLMAPAVRVQQTKPRRAGNPLGTTRQERPDHVREGGS
jgi:hypothetical protein